MQSRYKLKAYWNFIEYWFKKSDSFQRIMEFAENLAENHEYEKDLGERLTKAPNEGGYHYFNAKKVS